MSAPTPANCSGLANSGVPAKPPGRRNRSLRTCFIDRLCQAQVDDFRGHSAFLLEAHHDIARFDVPVNEALLVHRSQTGGDLRRNFQRQLYVKRGPSA